LGNPAENLKPRGDELGIDDECREEGCALEALQRRGARRVADEEARGQTELDLQASLGCYEGSAPQYYLNWEANASNFFKDWTFVTHDPSWGAVNYLKREDAKSGGLLETYQDHVVIRTGALRNGKRDSVRIQTNKAWNPHDGFLVAMKYRHVPYGAGVWPAFWTMCSDYVWPKGGELDILEFANDQPNLMTFHTLGDCAVSSPKLQQCTPPYYALYDSIWMSCDTDYSHQKNGCKPPQKRYNGDIFNSHPGTMVAEWNDQNIKIWHFPAGTEPADLFTGAPRPATWDPTHLQTWFPFEDHSCKGLAFGKQELVINTDLCGQFAGNTWELSPLSFLTGYRTFYGNCKSGQDCCEKWIQDPRSAQYLRDYAFWDIDWIKVFTPGGDKTYAQASGTSLRHGREIPEYARM